MRIIRRISLSLRLRSATVRIVVGEIAICIIMPIQSEEPRLVLIVQDCHHFHIIAVLILQIFESSSAFLSRDGPKITS